MGVPTNETPAQKVLYGFYVRRVNQISLRQLEQNELFLLGTEVPAPPIAGACVGRNILDYLLSAGILTIELIGGRLEFV